MDGCISHRVIAFDGAAVETVNSEKVIKGSVFKAAEIRNRTEVKSERNLDEDITTNDSN